MRGLSEIDGLFAAAGPGKLEGDAAGGPFAVSPPLVDESEGLDRQPRGPASRSNRAILTNFNAVVAVELSPFRQGRLGDPTSAATWVIG